MAVRVGAALLLLGLASCQRNPIDQAEVRPDWSRFTIDGIAPLMAPARVGRALAAHGYKPSDCGVGRRIDPRALERATDLFCYDDAGRGWRASLYFLPLVEGRRLAVINFRDLDNANLNVTALKHRNQAFLGKLIARFGKPDHVQTSFGITARLWKVPGGSASLPDNIKTDDSGHAGRSVEATSFWAYGHQRPTPQASGRP